jgi:hypothetical protein
MSKLCIKLWHNRLDGRLAFEDIIRATGNFDDKYIIGEGGYGKVYLFNWDLMTRQPIRRI